MHLADRREGYSAIVLVHGAIEQSAYRQARIAALTAASRLERFLFASHLVVVLLDLQRVVQE